MDDDWVKKYHKHLGLFIHREGQPVVFNAWFGIYARFLWCLHERWRPLWDSGEFDLDDLNREMRVLLPTPEAWQQAQIEMQTHELHLRNLKRMSVEELTDYLETLKCIDPALVNLGILERIAARRGQTGGLPSALKEVLAPEIEHFAQSWLASKARSNEYIQDYGSLPLLARWGKKGIGKGLKKLDECEDLDIVGFLLEDIEAHFQVGYDSIMHRKWGKGPKDVLTLKHRGKLISLSKTLTETEDEDNPDAYKLTIEDQIVSDLDDEIRADRRFEEIVEHLTDEKRKLFLGRFLGDVSAIELSTGEEREYQQVRQAISRIGRFVKEAFKEGEIPQKRPRGRPRKKDK